MDITQNRKDRIRRKAKSVSSKPRLSYEKSNRFMSFQLIDDKKQITIFGVHQKQVTGKTQEEINDELAKKIVDLLKQNKVNDIFVDRGARKYQGNLASIIEKIRKAGVKV